VTLQAELPRWLSGLSPGRPACVFSDGVEDTLAVLQQTAASESPTARAISLTWREVPPLANELGLLVSALAKAAPAFFPALYGLRQGERTAQWSATQVESEAHTTTRAVPGVDGFACRRILEACYRGQVPNLGKLARAQQVRQLALAIDPQHLIVFIAELEVPANLQTLRSLAQGAEWLATNCTCRVVLVLPDVLVGRQELDHVSYGARIWSRSGDLISIDESTEAQHSQTSIKCEHKEKGANGSAEPLIDVSPIVGRPATNSEAEQELYQALIADEELRPLFAYNQQVPTLNGRTPIVDILWSAGKLVIEVDGQDHRGVKKFRADRLRDYELWLAGYSVIRFTAEDVLIRVAEVIALIRAAVRAVRQREKP
jgi:very-short-patch-repair endonuclease